MELVPAEDAATLHDFDVSSLSVLKEELICVCCQELLCDPITTECGHTFCAHCLKEWVVTGQGRTCPQCRCDLSRDVPKVNILLRKTISLLLPKAYKLRQAEVEERSKFRRQQRQQQQEQGVEHSNVQALPSHEQNEVHAAANAERRRQRQANQLAQPVDSLAPFSNHQHLRRYSPSKNTASRIYFYVLLFLSLPWMAYWGLARCRIRTLLSLEVFLSAILSLKAPVPPSLTFAVCTFTSLEFFTGYFFSEVWEGTPQLGIATVSVACAAFAVMYSFQRYTHHTSGWRVAPLGFKRLMLITFFVTIVTWYQALETQQYFEAALCVEIFLINLTIALKKRARTDEGYAIAWALVTSSIAVCVRRQWGIILVGYIVQVQNILLIVCT